MKKTIVVLVVLALGVGGALLFRRSPQTPSSFETELNISRSVSAANYPASGSRRAGMIQGVPLRKTPADALHPSFKSSDPPPLPNLTNFNKPRDETVATLPGQPVVVEEPAREPGVIPKTGTLGPPPLRLEKIVLPRIHTIANGDTLERIARRYLGSEQFAGDILLWNQGVIEDRLVLPIGQVIKIPPKPPSPGAVKSLVPLPGDSLSQFN